MFNFKPRVYRSAEGCCICKAKSSSSRFTESIKYEEDFAKCFDLKHPRSGQICNACVLLVKRFKRLPAGSQRNWGHVVDARAGPGTKTLMKIKRNKDEKSAETNSSQSRHTGKSVISEKFSKIFKKSKKLKLHHSPSRSTQAPTLVKQANSFDSDNEESSESSQELSKSNSPSVVLFQTQTRASAFRSRHKVLNKPVTVTKSNDLVVKKPQKKLSGSKKRKKFKPKKLHSPFEHDDVQFFDENEWVRKTTCCGIFYECAKLNNAMIIDVGQYKVCSQHHQLKEQKQSELQQLSTLNALPKSNCAIKATLPAVVKLSLPLTALSSNNNSQPVLKKHHLFFKRQAESFPREDLTAVPSLATVKTDNAEEHSAAAALTMAEKSTNAVQAQHSITATLDPIVTNVPSAAGAAITSTLNIKSSNFLHKIRSDAGKIVKHSFEKLNTAVRLKAHDLMEIKNLVKTVDKSHVLNMTNTTEATQQQSSAIAITKAPVDEPSTNMVALTTTKFSDNSSDSGFDENVQDRKSVSPMQQENDIKNILPPRPPVQTLILASGVRVHGQAQNLVYAGNEAAAKILQNRITTQNNNTLLQYNKRINVQTNNNNTVDSTSATATVPSLATLKLVHPTKANPNCLVSIGAYGNVKMRALYKNNAIRHENGITTILPASSLAAVNQQSQISMHANAPNTITITPAVVAAAASLQGTSTSTPTTTLPSTNILSHIPNRRAI